MPSEALEETLNVFKRLELYISAIFKLGKTERRTKSAERLAEAVNLRLLDLEDRINQFEKKLPSLADDFLSTQVSNLSGRHAELARGYSDLTRRIDQMVGHTFSASKEVKNVDTGAPDPFAEAPGFEALQQSFYHRLENKYRGSLADIRNKLRVHLPDIESAFLRTDEKPILDLGCGRGEWLELLKRLEIPSLGVDTNAYQISEVLRDGHNVRLADAVETLREAESSSYAAITAFHLIEHLPFETVLWMTREALRVLAPGGVLLFETPNVRNILVGSTSFHNDPTHLHPLTDPVLTVLFETCGYEEIEVRLLNPHERLNEFRQRENFDEELAYLMFGPQDVAIIGRKPKLEP